MLKILAQLLLPELPEKIKPLLFLFTAGSPDMWQTFQKKKSVLEFTATWQTELGPTHNA